MDWMRRAESGIESSRWDEVTPCSGAASPSPPSAARRCSTCPKRWGRYPTTSHSGTRPPAAPPEPRFVRDRWEPEREPWSESIAAVPTRCGAGSGPARQPSRTGVARRPRRSQLRGGDPGTRVGPLACWVARPSRKDRAPQLSEVAGSGPTIDRPRNFAGRPRSGPTAFSTRTFPSGGHGAGGARPVGPTHKYPGRRRPRVRELYARVEPRTSASPEAVYRMGLLAMELVTAAVRGAVAQSPP